MLGHRVSPEGIQPEPERVQAVKDAKPPSNKKKLQSFLGLVGYCRKLIHNLSSSSKPLYDLLKKDIPNKVFSALIESSVIQETFKKVKDSISKDAHLAFPDISQQFILTTDASAIGSGAILLQVQNGSERSSHILVESTTAHNLAT